MDRSVPVQLLVQSELVVLGVENVQIAVERVRDAVKEINEEQEGIRVNCEELDEACVLSMELLSKGKSGISMKRKDRGKRNAT